MKLIALPFRHHITLPAGEFNVTTATDTINKLRDRGSRIIASSLAIEDVVVQILSLSLFGEIKDRRELVTGLVLQSDWCSFSAKRKLLRAAITTFNLLPSADTHTLDGLLACVMRYRNAFAHGSIAFNGSEYMLKYFEGSPMSSILNDAYWEKLESDYDKIWVALLAIETKLENPDIINSLPLP